MLRMPRTARRTNNKSAIDEFKSTTPQDALIKKQQLSYFGHIMQNSFEKSINVGNGWRHKKERQTTSTLDR